MMADLEQLEQEREQVVLIAEHDRLEAQVIATTLDLKGLQVAVAHNGNQALDLAYALQPDLILLDVMLPLKSGFEVCATLKRDPATSSIPIVVLTAQTDLSSRMAGISAGANEYLTKPFSPTQLIDLVKRVLAGESAQPEPSWPDPSTARDDQWMIYARELREVYEREQVAQKELGEIRARLEGQNQLQTDFLGTITHELLTPFGAIGLAMQVLQQQSTSLPLDYQEAVADLEHEIAEIHRMVNGLVKFAELMHKRREPELDYYELDQIIPVAVQPVAAMAQARGIVFQCVIPPNLPRVFADREMLSEAVFQMAHNAIKFNKPGGSAWVRAFESDGWISIEVTDTGAGLTPDRLVLLGQPFEQHADALRRGREGLGVGWAFVGFVAHVHYGRSHVESPGPDQGSTFTLSLPLVAER
jgi:signal transduction histidine kinase